MNLRSRIHPREEHVAELTRGIRLPYPPLPRTQMVLIAQVLIRAWDDLLGKWPSKLSSGGETELDSLMEIKLNALRDEDVLWMQLVSGMSRGSETMSYNGSHLEKRPDLSIHLTTRNSSFSLIVECKLIDASSKKTIDLYCNKGLLRFVDGEYAWASREAFMLAYVRDKSTITSCLTPFLAASKARQPDVYLTEVLPFAIEKTALRLACSSHNRAFRYISELQDSPGAIAIWHLWADAPVP